MKRARHTRTSLRYPVPPKWRSAPLRRTVLEGHRDYETAVKTPLLKPFRRSRRAGRTIDVSVEVEELNRSLDISSVVVSQRER